MRSSKRLVVVLACVLVACGDDAGVTSETDASTGEESTGDETDTLPTTTIEPTSPSTSATTSISETTPATETTDDTDGTTSDTDVTESSATTEVESSSSTTGGDPICGDGEVNGDDECDGTDLDLLNCVALDFDGGQLACNGDCTFDTSGCSLCGDSTISGDEECELDDLGGSTCADAGFVDGDLACANDCTFDTSNCTSCGNDVIDDGEQCDGDNIGMSSCLTIIGFTGGTLGCDDGCFFDTAACTNLPRPGDGDIVITEFLQNPDLVEDPDGEWFEVHNPSVGATYQLGGCTVEGNMNDTPFMIDVDLEIGPGEYLVFGDDTALDPGFVADYEWPGADFNLNNTSDEIRIVCDGVTADEVIYDDGATFPDVTGAAASLNPDFLNAADNDIGGNWCAATSSYNGDLGTPGAANDACGGETTYTIGFCRLQFPSTIGAVQGTDVSVFGRVFVDGLTNLTGGNDPAAEVIGYVGYGPDGSDPAVDAGWVWSTGTPNVGYGPASPAYEANNDEYVATLTVPAAGEYDYAFRFSGDSGATFLYCDGGDPGSSDGYAPADAGQMTATGAPPPANLYFSEYVEGSMNNKAIEIFNADGGVVDLDGCEVRIYFNGSMAATNILPLSGMLANDGTFVLCDDGITDAGPCDAVGGGNFWNGDDAVELNCNGITVDVFGEIGFDPGSTWSMGGVSTENHTLRRLCTVTTGDTNGADDFDPSLQWEQFAVDIFDDLGVHVCP